jgi:DNA-binding FadR family transcriptional regulator
MDLDPHRRARNNHEHVMHELGLGIVRGDFPEGSLLPGDAELTGRFSVSRTVLREALKTLAAKGLIQPRARVGTRVLARGDWHLFDPEVLSWHFEAGVSRELFFSLAEMRLALEPEAAALAAERRTPEQLDDLRACIAAMDDPACSPHDFAALDVAFHANIAAASANPFMQSVTALVEVALAASFALTAPGSNQFTARKIVTVHRQIIDAVEARDTGGARQAMRMAIEQGLRRARSVLDDSRKD